MLDRAADDGATAGAGRPRPTPVPAAAARRRLGPEQLPAPPHDDLPLALAELHRALPVGRAGRGSLHRRARRPLRRPTTTCPGRNFWRWCDEHLVDVFTGAGFDRRSRSTATQPRFVDGRRGPGPCPTPSARACACWCAASTRRSTPPTPASGSSRRATASGRRRSRPGWRRSTATRGTRCATHGMGMTDLVKRATRRADELDRRRVPATASSGSSACAAASRPAAVCMVGLAGWRAAVDRTGRGRLAGPHARRPARLRDAVDVGPQRPQTPGRLRRPPPQRRDEIWTRLRAPTEPISSRRGFSGGRGPGRPGPCRSRTAAARAPAW